MFFYIGTVFSQLRLPWFCLAAILGCGAGASAQTIYTVVDAAGHKVFTDHPEPALRADTQSLPPFDRPIDVTPDGRSDVDYALSTGLAISSRRSMDVNIKEAARRSQQSKAKRNQSAQLILGGTVPGTSPGALNEHYWLRPDMLQRQIDEGGRRSGDSQPSR
jgi:hypothetical protein